MTSAACKNLKSERYNYTISLAVNIKLLVILICPNRFKVNNKMLINQQINLCGSWIC